MSADDRIRWDAKYAGKSLPEALLPDAWLKEQTAALSPGRALDLACGLGHNAVWLARQGWRVDAVDISPVGLKLARQFAIDQQATVNWIAADLDRFAVEPQAYDLVVVFRFLDRTHLPELVAKGLRSGGRLLYETFTISQLERPDSHLKNPAFALQPGELPRLFPSLTVVTYDECDLPDRSTARLVAERP